jgi:hypothetical protein
MADTLADITLTAGVWLDVYNASGIAPQSDLIIKNKSTSVAYIQVKASTPTVNTDGWPLNPLASSLGGDWTTITKVPAGSRVWIRGTGKIFVQLFD